MLVRLFLVLMCFGVSLPLALTQPGESSATPALDPGSIALKLQSRQHVAAVNYDGQLLAAQRAFAAGNYNEVEARLRALSERTFLDSRAIELAYNTQRATGQDSTAAATLREGLATYPHAVRLLRIGPSEAALADELSVADIEGERRYPESLRAELRAVLAFRQNRSTTALLEAERAAYLYQDRGDGLGQLTMQAVAEVYARLLSQEPKASAPIAAPDLSFDEAYHRAFTLARQRLDDGGLDTLSQLAQAAKLRAVALRLFVRDGGLARYPDPMLVDLYVLDRAGHLETATMLQLGWMAPAELLELERSAPSRVLRARTYITETWRDDADAYLR